MGGCNHIVLACGTAHAFLPDVYRMKPEYKKYVLNIIEISRKYILQNNIDEIFLIAAEGTLRNKVYNDYFEETGIEINCPNEDEYYLLRKFIESVKRDQIDDCIMDEFVGFLSRHGSNNVVLGCTEFPVLVSEIRKCRNLDKYVFIDPLELTIKELKQILN